MQAMAKFDLLAQPFSFGARLFGRRNSAGQRSVAEAVEIEEVRSVPATATRSKRPRRSLALIWLLDADCPSCRGFGCAVCFDSGLA
jgi:hypothetical protein